MTLPLSGALAMSAVNTELSRATGATTSLGETTTRGLAGVASGAISFSSLYGKSNAAPAPTFSPVSGTYNIANDGSVSFTITCSASATWTWSRSGSTLGQSTVTSGGSATSITLSLATTVQDRTCTFTVTGASGGVTQNYTVVLTAWGSGTF